MQHMILHLAAECLKGGANWARWQYPLERETQKLRQMTGNKCKIEASISAAVLNVEVADPHHLKRKYWWYSCVNHH
jgi:hypothetical protein